MTDNPRVYSVTLGVRAEQSGVETAMCRSLPKAAAAIERVGRPAVLPQ